MEHKFVVTVEYENEWDTPRVTVDPMTEDKIQIGDEVFVDGVFGIVIGKVNGFVTVLIPDDNKIKMIECRESSVSKTRRNISIMYLVGARNE